MYTMKRVICCAVLILTLAALAFAQAPAAPPVVAAKEASPKEVKKPVPASPDSQLAILKAEHELDLIKQDITDIAQKFSELQRQADILNPRYKADQEKEKTAESAVNAALEAVWKANGFSKDQYNFDPANMTFTEKVDPKPTTAQVVHPSALK
jgi:TolA-binding protein